jgi:hypothetical protein
MAKTKDPRSATQRDPAHPDHVHDPDDPKDDHTADQDEADKRRKAWEDAHRE